MIVKSLSKKYQKLDGYAANAYSIYSMVIHLSKKFKLSEHEIRKALEKHKIIIYG
jgi:hypothetical protein